MTNRARYLMLLRRAAAGFAIVCIPSLAFTEEVLPPCSVKPIVDLSELTAKTAMTLNAITPEEPAPAKKSGAPSPANFNFAPPSTTSISDIRCRPTLGIFANRVTSRNDFAKDGSGPPAAWVVTTDGHVLQRNRPAGEIGYAKIGLKEIQDDHGNPTDYRQRVVGPVLLIRLDPQGQPIMRDGKVDATEAVFVRVSPTGELLLAPNIKAAYIPIEQNGQLCVPAIEIPEKDAKVPIVSANGEALPVVAPKSPRLDPGCEALHPIVRFGLNNLIVGANFTHSNSALNAFSDAYENSTALKSTTTDTYQYGAGWVGKRILPDLLAVVLNDKEGYKALERQGKWYDVMLLNPVSLSATVSGGRILQVTDGTEVKTTTDAPFYAISVSYTVPLQDIAAYAFGWGRPTADSGYVYHGTTPDGRRTW